MKRYKWIQFIFLILCGLFLVHATTWAKGPEKITLPLFTNPCQESEKWKISPLIPEKIRSDLKSPPNEREDALESLAAAYEFRAGAFNVELQALGDYLIARAFYGMNWIHIAHRSFQALIKPASVPSIGMEVSSAALACVLQIHSKYPALRLKAELTPSLRSMQTQILNAYQKSLIWKALFRIAGRKLSDRTSLKPIDQELAGLQGSGPYEELVQISSAGKKVQEPDAISISEKFLKRTSLPAELISQVEPVRINLARYYYNQREYTKSLTEFKKISKESNLYPSSIMDASWAHFLLGDYAGAAEKTVNLIFRDLRTVFAPHAPVLLAITQHENCRYSDANGSLKRFKKTYGRIYHILQEWSKRQKTNPVDYYSIFIEYIRTQKGLPRLIGLEWSRSPELLAIQEEMNLLLEEQRITGQFKMELLERKGPFKRFSPGLTQYFSKVVEMIERSNTELEKTLILNINNILIWKNYSMTLVLLEAFDNAELLEADTLRRLGTKVLTKGRVIEKTRGHTGKKLSNEIPSLNWGDVEETDADSQSGSETWDDELGGVKVDLTNLCNKKEGEK